MKKYLVLFRAPAASIALMMKATPEQQEAGMNIWMGWSKAAENAIIDMGSPLGKTLSLTTERAWMPTTNDLCGFQILEAESREALTEILKGHPHFMVPNGTIDVVGDA